MFIAKNNNSDLGKFFNSNTKLSKISYANDIYEDKTSRPSIPKHYSIKKYKLDLKDINLNMMLTDAIQLRRSFIEIELRTIISFRALSHLLYFSYGIQSNNNFPVPSGGARYPISLYLVIFNVEDLEEGVYFYNNQTSELELIKMGNFREQITEGFVEKESIRVCSFIILSVTYSENVCSKYGDRGYRLLYLDSGHISQNLYLLSSSLNIGCRAILGYYDDALNEFLGLDGLNSFVVLSHVFGMEKKPFMDYIDLVCDDHLNRR